MIWLLLAFALYPPSIELAGMSGTHTEFELFIVGNERVRITATPPLVLDETVTITGKQHVTLTARIKPHTPPGNHTAYVYAEPAREDNILLAAAIPVRVAVHQPTTTTRIIPAHRLQAGWWAALAGTITAVVGLFSAVSIRRR